MLTNPPECLVSLVLENLQTFEECRWNTKSRPIFATNRCLLGCFVVLVLTYRLISFPTRTEVKFGNWSMSRSDQPSVHETVRGMSLLFQFGEYIPWFITIVHAASDGSKLLKFTKRFHSCLVSLVVHIRRIPNRSSSRDERLWVEHHSFIGYARWFLTFFSQKSHGNYNLLVTFSRMGDGKNHQWP